MAHDHHHHHPAGDNLRVAFFLNLGFTIFEIIGGYYVNSVAIISDAIHDLGDSLSLGTAWYLDKKSKQTANHQYSFGYARFSLLGALINSVVLIAGSIYVISEAIQRIRFPEQTDARGMFFFAVVGIAVNGYAAWKMSSGKSLNERIVSWHLLEDVLGWAAILIASVLLFFWNIPYLDPALSLAITLYILWNVIQRLRETLFLFLQGTPADIHLPEIEEKIVAIEQVASVHHPHIWSLDGEHHVLTMHVKLGAIRHLEEVILVKKEIQTVIKKYPFAHFTIETELEEEICGLE